MDQSSFAAPHGFSQRITSFIACACQGIHQMPLRHLIVLIANAHRLVARSKGTATDRVTFYNPVNPTMPLTCSTGLLIGATPSSSLAACLKTSFSRYDPIPRGQATAIKSSVRCSLERPQTTTTQSDKLPTYSSPSPISGRLGHPWDHQNWARTPWAKPKTPGSLQINLLFTMYAEHASAISRCKTFISSKDISFTANTIHQIQARGRRPSLAGPSGACARRARQRQDRIWWS